MSDVYQLSTYRVLKDKNDERGFVENDIYLNNDPDVIQSRSRTAMFVLNSLLLFLFAVAARRFFGDIIALAAVTYLVIDPTVAAHLPLVMTDLPVALLSTDILRITEHTHANFVRGNGIFGSIYLTRFVCADCGYTEQWVDSSADIKLLREKHQPK